MKPRRKQPERTRRAVLEAAGAEFARHGYAATGLGAIVSRAELTKGALFHHFTDKRAMALAWVEDFLAPEIAARWVAPLLQLGSLDELKGFCRARCMELKPEDATSALVAMTAETAAADELLGAALERVFTSWRAALTGLFERGKAEGWIHRSIQPAAEAMFLVSAVAGFCVTQRSTVDDASRRACATALEAYLETLRAQ